MGMEFVFINISRDMTRQSRSLTKYRMMAMEFFLLNISIISNMLCCTKINLRMIKKSCYGINAITLRDCIIIKLFYDNAFPKILQARIPDGASATALLGNFFDHINQPYEIFIPDRIKDGYGPSVKSFHKFINKNDFSFNGNTEDLLWTWCAKESMYKIYGESEIFFKDHLIIKKNDKNTLIGQCIHKNYLFSCQLNKIIFNNYFLVYTSNFEHN